MVESRVVIRFSALDAMATAMEQERGYDGTMVSE